jgi:hypothetical protein
MMGGGSWNSTAWTSFKTANVQGKSGAQIFASGLNPDVDPLNFTNGIRESVDSDDNPNSTPVAIFADMTSSMGPLSQRIITDLDVVCQELIDRAPVPDVHLMTGVIGDAYSDGVAPIQVTQFEADIRIAEQTKKLWRTSGGGGNGGESYALAWLFAAMQTKTDSFDKRGKKGYLFTVGDEGVHGVEGTNHSREWGVTKDQAKRWLGLDIERDLSADECLAMARRKWNVFHIVINPDYGYSKADVANSFGKIMPDNLLYLEDVAALTQTIVSTIEVNEGRDAAKVAASWGGDTSLVVANAMKALAVAGDTQGVVRL